MEFCCCRRRRNPFAFLSERRLLAISNNTHGIQVCYRGVNMQKIGKQRARLFAIVSNTIVSF